jgi:hypothetical protein
MSSNTSIIADTGFPSLLQKLQLILALIGLISKSQQVLNACFRLLLRCPARVADNGVPQMDLPTSIPTFCLFIGECCSNPLELIESRSQWGA